jgi:excisionase family DNA binding protein
MLFKESETSIMEYMTTKQAAERWGISDRRVCLLCAAGRIDGTIREGRKFLISPLKYNTNW